MRLVLALAVLFAASGVGLITRPPLELAIILFLVMFATGLGLLMLGAVEIRSRKDGQQFLRDPYKNQQKGGPGSGPDRGSAAGASA